MKTALIISLGLACMLQDKTIAVRQPSFSRVEFMDNDKLRFVTYFNNVGERMYADQYDFLSGVDSCATYIVDDVKSSYHPVTVLREHPYTLVATYKRVNDSSWICSHDQSKYLVIENRRKIVAGDTVQKEDPLNPGTYLLFVTEYYDVTIK